MRFLLFLAVAAFALFPGRPYLEEVTGLDFSFADQAVNEIVSHPFVQRAANEVERLSGIEMSAPEPLQSPALLTPDNQTFSVHNVQIGQSRSDAEQSLGTPTRSSLNEYGTDWHAYHDQYRNFSMISYNDSGQVAALYTNQPLISSKNGLTYGSTRATVRSTLGEPMTRIRKGLTLYVLNSTDEYDMFELDGCYVTFFYDVHKQNTVTGLLIVEKSLEDDKTALYGPASDSLQAGFEQQLFDVTNAERVMHELPVLSPDEEAAVTARAHSLDMARNHYFDHTNLQGQSPFDRLEENGISFTTAGENLAYGQFSSIFAHEGLMNSSGHRKNIVNPEFRALGTGVSFNENDEPYFTQNFLTR